MIKETRTIHYDAELAIEAYWLQNVLDVYKRQAHEDSLHVRFRKLIRGRYNLPAA